MAYSAPTSDFITSTLSGAISAGADAATIGTGLDIPATNGILQIDYDSTEALGASDGPETVAYATYTSGTGALTGMTRGLNGTTGVSHANGATVQAGPSASYWGTGSIVSADIGAVLLNANLATTAGEPGGAWKDWTPTWANLTVGNGTVTAKYTQIGKTIHFRLLVTLGSGSSVSGAITFSLPVNCNAEYGTSGFNIGVARFNDTGTASFSGITTILTASTAKIFPTSAGGTYTSNSDTSSTVPHTWAATDIFIATGTYEAA